MDVWMRIYLVSVRSLKGHKKSEHWWYNVSMDVYDRFRLSVLMRHKNTTPYL